MAQKRHSFWLRFCHIYPSVLLSVTPIVHPHQYTNPVYKEHALSSL
jgi:hypothetical protein